MLLGNSFFFAVLISILKIGYVKCVPSEHYKEIFNNDSQNEQLSNEGPRLKFNPFRHINETDLDILPLNITDNNIDIWNQNVNYRIGDFGGYYYIGHNKSYIYFHGKYHEPTFNYYGNYKHTLQDTSALGYYIGYGMLKMNHNEYFKHHNFTHFNIHHHFFNNSTMLSEQTIESDHIVLCAKNTTVICPENTEAICLLNTTVWCASILSTVKPCQVKSMMCVTTRLPCIKLDDKNCHEMVEVIDLPCMANVTILDANEDKNGTTLYDVAGTFILDQVSPVQKRTYCVTIVAEPSMDED